MDVVALVSGGKDSCYSILKCQQHGHRVIALAHILPPVSTPEPDSHMYQSVASSAVATLAQALSLPLHTVRTAACAVTKTLSYTPTPNDEVEDLVTLLLKVRASHPTLRAVCAGALWSDYQRLRVESAASRAGLLSLAYLWRRDQVELLDEMIAAGVRAVLVKVAGIGLGVEHLGKDLEEMRPTLWKLAQKFGSHVCGEGGEFETFVTWMPGFHQSIVLDNVETVMHSFDPVAPVSYLAILECHLEPLSMKQQEWPALPPAEVPGLFRDLEETDLVELEEVQSVPNAGESKEQYEETSAGSSTSFLQVVVKTPKAGREGVVAAAKRLEAILEAHGETLSSVLYVQLFLRSVSGEKYIEANRGYNEVFGIAECTPPPSRACIGSGENNHPTIVEALVRKNRSRASSDSFTLHVQSLSEWAPPCIGPYAQLVEEDGIVHVSGVLALYAPLANIPHHLSARRQLAACAYNLQKTLEASRSCFESLGLFVIYVVAPSLVTEVWEEISRTIEHKQAISMILPAAELPKGGLVEVRAVGTIDPDDLHKPEAESRHVKRLQSSGLCCSTVLCGVLGFAAVTYIPMGNKVDQSFAELLQLAMSAPEFEICRDPISLQIYVHESERRNFSESLKASFPNSAISILRSVWMPHEATFISLATFELKSPS